MRQPLSEPTAPTRAPGDEAGVLHERVAELSELQEVFSRTWAD